MYVSIYGRGSDKAVRPTQRKFAEGVIWMQTKRRSVGSPPKEFSVGSKRARFVGKRSNRAQANGKPLFQAAFLQFSANCDAGAY